MTRTITIFQIGDIHYDRLCAATTLNDPKDPRPPGGIKTAFERNLAPIVAQSLSAQLKSHPEAIVAICGDLTTAGDRAHYRSALNYIQAIMSPIAGEPALIDPDRIHLVPGNHDVDYKTGGSMPCTDDLGTDRFTHLQDDIDRSDFSSPLTQGTRTSTYTRNQANIQLTSINTCRACGTPRELPALNLTDPLYELIAAHLKIDKSALLSAVKDAATSSPRPGEILDIPLLHPDDLHELQQAVLQSPSRHLPVFLAHHGFLPQVINRINVYTEMVNGGQVRESLLKLGRPSVYLHGHVHRDSVEILRGGPPEHANGGPLVVIAAPLLLEGYNEIGIEFAEDGTPLGLILSRHRISRDDGVVRRQQPQRISLLPRLVTESRFKPVIAYLHDRSHALGRDIRNHLPTLNGAKTVPDTELVDYLSRATWSGLIEIHPETLGQPFDDREYLFL